jgi:hypothetical protein
VIVCPVTWPLVVGTVVVCAPPLESQVPVGTNVVAYGNTVTPLLQVSRDPDLPIATAQSVEHFARFVGSELVPGKHFLPAIELAGAVTSSNTWNGPSAPRNRTQPVNENT